jgi:hypothetical protein
MLATPEDAVAVTMSFVSLALQKPWSSGARNTVHLLSKLFLMVTLFLKHREYFASISILLVAKKLLTAIPYSCG